jgi:tripartite-type tricarboxylate transporter receptor subunit TctC
MNRRLAALGSIAAALTVALTGCASNANSANPEVGNDAGAGFAEGETIKWIVPSAAGAANDTLARIMAPRMGEELGATVQVVNVEGGNQVIGISQMAESDPDGLTIGYTNIPSILGRYLDPTQNAPFDRSSFAPLGSFATNDGIIAVNADSPYETLDDLIDAAKAAPGELNSATDSRAGDDHIHLVLLEDALGVTYNIVHFDSGSDKVAAVVGKQVEFAVGGLASYYGPIQSGDIRALAVVADEPSPFLPDVPTLESLGYDMEPMTSFFTVSAPAGTPEAILDALEAAMKATVEDPAVAEQMTAAAFNAGFTPREEVATLWAEREARVEPVITAILSEQ